ncbi:MAG: GEVED domain-containing protein, partial [Bacteroidales bacterium]
MKKYYVVLVTGTILLVALAIGWGFGNSRKSKEEKNLAVDTRIDNLNYWMEKAKQGLVPYNPETKIVPARFTGSKIVASGVLTEDSPDVPITAINSTQSENSVFVDPNNPEIILNSNNSSENPLGAIFGADELHSNDAGEIWEGEIEGVSGDNSGDPATAIGLDGRWFINYISLYGGVGISYSEDQGTTWIPKIVSPNPGTMADKNHLWIDNIAISPYVGNLYIAWTEFGGLMDTEIALAVSRDHGVTWTSKKAISTDVFAGGHNHGVNLSVGPQGEVYAVWVVYDSWPADESAIGFAKSLDGGTTWSPARRILDNIRGIRKTEAGKNIRVNSFPSATVDVSYGYYRGNIYVTWANIGTPGINTGEDVDIYLIKSSDEGNTWSEPIKINQDESNLGKKHFFPWIVCDPSNGALSAIFYDDRNTSVTELEVYCANSEDGGQTWEDFKVSDVAFTPSPIPGLLDNYFGDYLGITAQDAWVYPIWTDNRTGTAMSYTSPYRLNPLVKPENLTASVNSETGVCQLNWSYNQSPGFLHFDLYRGYNLISTTTDTVFQDALPDYGYYDYKVTAVYQGNKESGASRTSTQWGDAHINILTDSIYESLTIDSSSVKKIELVNTGQLDLKIDASPILMPNTGNNPTYCTASGGGLNEYIKRVQIGLFKNDSDQENYGDFTNYTIQVRLGQSYEFIITNGDPNWPLDQCGAWIDWDEDGEFTTEEEILLDGSPGAGPYTGIITPPSNAISSTTRLRVVLTNNEIPDPCTEYALGEVEDYTIGVVGWLGINPVNTIVSPGDTTEVEVQFDTHALSEGSYTALAHFFTNDPLMPATEIPIKLDVSTIQVTAGTANGVTSMCPGTSFQLTAQPSGPITDLTYYWNSVPAGFESDEQNPVTTTVESAWYRIRVGNGTAVALDSIFIEALPVPVINLVTDTILCGDQFITLNPG